MQIAAVGETVLEALPHVTAGQHVDAVLGPGCSLPTHSI